MFAGIGERIELTHRATDRKVLPGGPAAAKGQFSVAGTVFDAGYLV